MNEILDPALLEEIEKESFEEDDYNEMPPDDIISFNELRSCADLYRMYEEGILDISPDFQREVVWKRSDQTRFIDSLIKQLPIPSMCFALDYKEQKWIVIDGLQRMSSIINFLKGGDWKLSNLLDITPDIRGKTAFKIKESEKLRRYYLIVQNLTIPITILRCDLKKKSHTEYLFTIFHRLNSGGVKLTNQEIRNCIYNGKFNTLLKKLDKYENWVNIKKPNYSVNRMRSIELILRFFAFNDNYEKYNGRLSKFLNDYMQKNRNPSNDWLEEKEFLFKRVVSLISEALKNSEQINSVTLLEAVMIGVSRNIDKKDKEYILTRFNEKMRKLLSSPAFAESEIREGISKKNKVINRLKTAEEVFAE